MTRDSAASKLLPPWRDLAQALLSETDQTRILELASQLAEAIESQVLTTRKSASPGRPARPASP
jgi:hypothetical protein